jgi:acyl-CoA synthetase (AMP-forming)/AMP-acid ligase II/acyl carrier protein
MSVRLDPAERETVGFSTLIDVLRWRACEQPERSTFTFLADGERDEAGITNAELDARARAIAAELTERGLRGERALLLYPPGLDLIAAVFGCLYAGTVAVLAYPPDPGRLDRTLPRLLSIQADAQPGALLTTAAAAGLSEQMFGGAAEIEALPRLATDDVDIARAAGWRDPEVKKDGLALLQYTSGSTAEPRGVMLTHAGLLDNIRHIQRSLEFRPDSRLALWLPPYHDMGLIAGILAPLYSASAITLMSPNAFLRRPARWLQAISRHKATICGGPNFAFDLCTRKITPEQMEGVDLGSLKLVWNGAETVRPETLHRFADAFGDHGFRSETFFPCYGLAEAGLLVSGGLLPAASFRRHGALLGAGSGNGSPSERFVSCGRPISGHRVEVVDPERRTPCAPEETGEIWISGPSVAAGYWNRPEQSADTFQATLADGDGPFLRTGDLGFLRDGELYISSRMKDLIVIRGRNILPQDVERTVEASHSALRPGAGAAFGLDVDATERLVVVQEVRDAGPVPLEEVAAAIRAEVAVAHEVQPYAVALIEARSIPKTSSGKIQRGRTRDAFLAGTLPLLIELRDGAVLPAGREVGAGPDPEGARRGRQEIEDWLVAEIARWLGVGTGEIDVGEPFVAYGLDSASSLALVGDLEDLLGVTLPETLAWDYPSIAALTDHLVQVGGPAARPVPQGG